MAFQRKFKRAFKKRRAGFKGRRRNFKKRPTFKRRKMNLNSKNVGNNYTTVESANLGLLVSGAVPTTGIVRFDPADFPRVVSISGNYQFYRVKHARVEFVPLQDANAYYQIQATANGLEAITYIELDGIGGSAASSSEGALARPFAKRQNLRHKFSRSWKPNCTQTITLQDAIASSTTTSRPISPWLTTSASGLSIDRVGVGFFIPAIAIAAPTTLQPTWQPRLTVTFEFKMKQVG